ncbi:MAG: hypothetical protein HND47_08680 [Chloroflexi bacterium]|nr:hypothetical protein [Chloroflexota bacterium]
MKTYKHLYPQLCSFDNLYLAYLKAKKGKSGKAPVADFMRKPSARDANSPILPIPYSPISNL